MKIGKYNNRVMTDLEVLTFVETAVENGSDPNEAIEDFKMIDALFEMRKMYIAQGHHVRKTRSGNFRKGSTMSNFLEMAIEARINGQFNNI